MDDKQPIAIIAVVLVLVLAAGAWWMFRPAAPGNTSPTAVSATEAPIDRPARPPVDLPPRDRMDGFLRPLLAALSTRPELARWLATDDLIGQLAAAINQAAGGGSPARDFKVLAPSTRFVPSGRGSSRAIDPASYQRYDGLVQTVTSIDAANVARIYRTIRPRLNEAYRGMGHPNGDVDQAVQQALELLLETPAVKDPVAIVEGGAFGWLFANDDLESLEPTQKQLLRMGPANADALKVWLRALQAALQ
ncbi:MAG: DUF3014 domain-containing protein [Vicinamibacterales bacterium]